MKGRFVTREWILPVITKLRKKYTVTFFEQRDIPLYYIDGELACILVSLEIVRKRNNTSEKTFDFQLPRSLIESGQDFPWIYFLFVSEKNKPLYRVKRKDTLFFTRISFTNSSKVPDSFEFVCSLSNHGKFMKNYKRDAKGLFARHKTDSTDKIIERRAGEIIYENTND